LAELPLVRLEGGQSHDVFLCDVDEEPVVIKVYRSHQREEHHHEWTALVAVGSIGAGPRALWFDPGGNVQDGGPLPPAVAMTFLEGRARNAEDYTASDLASVATGNRSIHHLRPSGARLANGHRAVILGRSRELIASWNGQAAHLEDQPEVVHRAGSLARRWLEGVEADGVVESAVEVFSRGDPHLRNYLWDGEERVRLVDFEDAGWSDPAFEAADLIEHAGSRALPGGMWEVVCDAYGFDSATRSRAGAGRRLAACFWLTVLERRLRRGADPVNLTIVEQAERLVGLLEDQIR
jgi:hypothetical protein